MQNLKILIVGAGVAGLTLAGLLLNQGNQPIVVEREDEEDFNKSGYMLGLLPLGGRVLNALSAREAYFESSLEMNAYEIHRQDGSLIRKYPLHFINDEYGSYRGIARTQLINILLSRADRTAIHFGSTVTGIYKNRRYTEVTFSNGHKEDFDLVVIADGIHSETRRFVLDRAEYSYRDTGWGGWVVWLEEEPTPTYREYWGSRYFLGLYPVKRRIGVFLGGPVGKIQRKGLDAFKMETREQLDPDDALAHRALDALGQTGSPFFWGFQDCRAEIWHRENVVLLGDAATGFLPTAGVGASMAMDSAAALADELSRVEPKHVDYGVRLFGHRQKERVEVAQTDSRRLGRLMFVGSPVIAALRDRLVTFYSLQRMLSGLSAVMEGK